MPRNKCCPSCLEQIKRLRDVPVYEGLRYCSSDCVLDAWEKSTRGEATRKAAADLAAKAFGRGTEENQS